MRALGTVKNLLNRADFLECLLLSPKARMGPKEDPRGTRSEVSPTVSPVARADTSEHRSTSLNSEKYFKSQETKSRSRCAYSGRSPRRGRASRYTDSALLAFDFPWCGVSENLDHFRHRDRRSGQCRHESIEVSRAHANGRGFHQLLPRPHGLPRHG
jgi:hypothetical protein